jgi:hypothetical protein
MIPRKTRQIAALQCGRNIGMTEGILASLRFSLDPICHPAQIPSCGKGFILVSCHLCHAFVLLQGIGFIGLASA